MPTLDGGEPSQLPTGVVTFLMTDVEGSSALWSSHSDRMSATLSRLDGIVGSSVRRFGGTLLKLRGEGDSHFAVFARPSGAVLAACDVQVALNSAPNIDVDLRVRSAVHAGEIDATDGDYYGEAVNQTARLRAVAHGGQTVLSQVTARLVEATLAERVRIKNLGYHRIRDFRHPQELFQATPLGVSTEFPPLRTGGNRTPALMAIVAVDVCGASAIVERGSDHVLRVHRAWVSVMRNVAESRDVVALKLLGDGCLAAFEDPANGLSFVRDLQTSVRSQGFDVRAGMEVGRIELFDGEIMGDALVVASQVCNAASPGEVVVSATLRELLGVGVAARSLGRRTLGISGVETDLYVV
jgi:class 3 adenylate cyclase